MVPYGAGVLRGAAAQSAELVFAYCNFVSKVGRDLFHTGYATKFKL
jgi:hypothetical protein